MAGTDNDERDRMDGSPGREFSFRPAPHMFDWRKGRLDNIRNILATDAGIFAYAGNILILTAWWVAVRVGFHCMDLQKEVHFLTNTGLWLMAIYGVIMGARLFLSIVLAANAVVGGAVGSGSMPKVMAMAVLASAGSYMAFAIVFVVANAFVQSQSSCWIMPDSAFEYVDPFLL